MFKRCGCDRLPSLLESEYGIWNYRHSLALLLDFTRYPHNRKEGER